jgi:smad nuclear-interacting protein 1
MSLYEQMNSIMSKSERRDVDPLIVDSSKVVWGKGEGLLKEDDEGKEEAPKFKADFGLSGALAKDEKTGNIVNGVVLKFTEPIDAAKPSQLWRFYVFKGDEIIETLHLHRQSAYLLGRDDRVADLLITHPSCSKQHAVILFRLVSKKKDDDTFSKKVTIIPYIIDLESTNGSYLNGKKLESSRYVELRPSDVLRFGESAREYVLLHEDITKTSLTQE